jgi:hypothetical protein
MPTVQSGGSSRSWSCAATPCYRIDGRRFGTELNHDFQEVQAAVAEMQRRAQVFPLSDADWPYRPRLATDEPGRVQHFRSLGGHLLLLLDAVGIKPFLRAAPWLDDLRSEILAFPHGLHDDQVDSIPQALNWFSRPRSKGMFISV